MSVRGARISYLSHQTRQSLCVTPLSEKDLQSNLYQKGISCSYCINETSDAQRASFRERQQQVELAEKRNEKHIGVRIN